MEPGRMLEGRVLELLALAAPVGPTLLVETTASESLPVLGMRSAQATVWVGLRTALPFLEEPGLSLVTVSEDPLAWLGQHPERFGLVVVGEAAGSQRPFVDACVERLSVGGFLVFLGALKNLLDGDAPSAPKPQAMSPGEQFHFYLRMHPQLLTTFLPLGHGIAWAIKSRITRRELGGPFG
jgi:hypothetical protein